MKLAYVSGSKIPSAHASSVHVMHMAEALADAGVEIVLYGKRDRAPRKSNPFKLYGIKPNFKLSLAPHVTTPSLSGAVRVAHILSRALLIDRPDAYYGRDAGALLLFAQLGRSVWFEAHQVPETAIERRVWARLFMNPGCKGVITISAALSRDLQDTFPELAEKPMLVAPDAAIPVVQDPPLPETWPGRKNHPQIGYTGSLHKGRGVEMIVNLADRLPEMDFHLVGGEAEQIANLLPEHVPQNLYFHGAVPHARIPGYLKMFDVVLAPYQATGGGVAASGMARWISPIKLFEYMAAGKAIICSDLPVLYEILENGRTGLFVKSDQPSEWVDAICQLTRDPLQVENMGRAAQETLLQHFTWDKRARRVLAFIASSRK